MYNRSTTSIFCLLLLSTFVKIDMSLVGTDQSQLSNLENPAQSPVLLTRVVHDANDRSPSPPKKTINKSSIIDTILETNLQTSVLQDAGDLKSAL